MADTKKAFVCGHPIKHSRSPLIHNHWLEQLGISGRYEKVDVAPDDFSSFVADIRSGKYIGGNFTMPHKETIFESVDHKDDAATAIGAVNTVWMNAGKLLGSNTDAYGFAANLDDQIPEWRKAKRALIIGAGGASRAIIHALIEAGIKEIDLTNRTLERAEKLATVFAPFVTPLPLDRAQSCIPTADLIINTTSLGMDENSGGLPIDLSEVKPSALASDIVYIPLETPFLKSAKKYNLKTSDGLGMLLHQAVPGFEKWFGVRPTVDDTLRQIILDDIAAEKSS